MKLTEYSFLALPQFSGIESVRVGPDCFSCRFYHTSYILISVALIINLQYANVSKYSVINNEKIVCIYKSCSMVSKLLY